MEIVFMKKIVMIDAKLKKNLRLKILRIIKYIEG